MIVLVVNLGSTSFKYKLFDMSRNESVLATGDADRIGQGGCTWTVKANHHDLSGKANLDDHSVAVDLHLDQLIELGIINSIEDISAIGFKAVHGGSINRAVEVDQHVHDIMQQVSPLAPAHNPPYIAAMKSFQLSLPNAQQVAAFETAFHQTIPLARQIYAVPYVWYEKFGIKRYGFHGASHAYIASRMQQIDPKNRKIINLHLGGSCSICAIENGKSVANSFGTTPQTGVFHNNRVGDFDPYAVLALKQQGFTEKEIYHDLSKNGGLLGISGISSDLRDVLQQAEHGHERSQLAVDAFVESCRHYLGAYILNLGGVDAITFTAGIGQYSSYIRKLILKNLDFLNIHIDVNKNEQTHGQHESRIDSPNSQTQLWVLPTNEELIVARQTVQVLNKQTT
ncbi:Acetate kinase [Poriferisphaera corsica]|uniref:Acetate kinase n=1 Tax=Poriferisphaera corsica TaxID=2528020 RepID=A0A517YUI8_9BACT|nr:acetate/propionate family kinase [Poriferisphaera corsica]QDU33909.1 Acetate kinase [Poriferisphaera corsica]